MKTIKAKQINNNEVLLDHVKHQEQKIADMKERVKLLNKAIPEIEATLKADKEKWKIK